ncbi:uncharacterized protein LOC131227106 isoform X2 [Magnolia sinica]|uniref:uncharacterized protein LOC131227106 isoform X2 n=1 Tax=Magnolia sinica TaxID=86752 RepID=UPI002657FF92|nr:uncharacterized protein LOC131227106 isoform X2 [Magnolia sinica]
MILVQPAGQNSHLMLSILVKHLDHKNVNKQPSMQINVVNGTTNLAQHSRLEPSVAIVGAINDLMRYSHKCFLYSIELPKLGDAINEQRAALHSALEKYLVQLANKLEKGVDGLFDSFARLDSHVSSVGQTAAKIGDHLQVKLIKPSKVSGDREATLVQALEEQRQTLSRTEQQFLERTCFEETLMIFKSAFKLQEETNDGWMEEFFFYVFRTFSTH